MKKVIIALFLCTSSTIMAQEKDYSKDVKSIESISEAYYDCLSGPIGQVRDFDRFRNLFHPSATFTYS